MRLMSALIIAGAVTAASSILNYSRVEAQTGARAANGADIPSKASATAADIKDRNFDLSIISKAIVEEASRLKSDAAGWHQKI
jgi:hypothetical protein